MSRENFIRNSFGFGFIGKRGIEGVSAVDGQVGALATGVEEGCASGAKLQYLIPITLNKENATFGSGIEVDIQKYGVGFRHLAVAKGEIFKLGRKVPLIPFLRLGMVDDPLRAV